MLGLKSVVETGHQLFMFWHYFEFYDKWICSAAEWRKVRYGKQSYVGSGVMYCNWFVIWPVLLTFFGEAEWLLEAVWCRVGFSIAHSHSMSKMCHPQGWWVPQLWGCEIWWFKDCVVEALFWLLRLVWWSNLYPWWASSRSGIQLPLLPELCGCHSYLVTRSLYSPVNANVLNL